MTATRVLTLTSKEVDRLVELVDELRRTGYVHAAEIDVRLGNLARLAGAQGVGVLQIVRRRFPERPGLVVGPGLYASREGQILRDPEPSADDLAIERFGWGRPVEIRTEGLHVEKHVMVPDGEPEGHSFFNDDRWEDRHGAPLYSEGRDAIRASVGPWYPNWFAANVPELLALGHVATQTRAIKALASDEELRRAADSARRLGGSDAVLALLEAAGTKES